MGPRVWETGEERRIECETVFRSIGFIVDEQTEYMSSDQKQLESSESIGTVTQILKLPIIFVRLPEGDVDDIKKERKRELLRASSQSCTIRFSAVESCRLKPIKIR
ncbi:hypothetical protein CBL_07128 [Carabus blaptoides fortunei]